MLLQFNTAELRLICEARQVAEQSFGGEVAPLFAALANLRAASNLGSLPPQLVREAESSLGVFHVDACDFHLEFVQNHRKAPMLGAGCLDLSRVTRIKITRVERYD